MGVNDEMGTILEGSGRDLMYLWGVGETMKNLRITCVLAEIRTKHLPNTSVERYRYASPLGRCVMMPLSANKISDPFLLTH
jgi:hypothetical protein